MQRLLSVIVSTLLMCALLWRIPVLVMGQSIIMPGFTAAATGPGTFTLLHSSPSAPGSCTGTGSTCTLTLSANFSSGDLVTIHCLTSTSDSPSLVSVNEGGTLMPVYSAGGNGNNTMGIPADGYIYPSASTSSTSFVLTFTGSTGGASCFVREYSVSTGTPVLDWANGTLPSASGTTVSGLSPTYSGTNDIVVQYAMGQSGFFTVRTITNVSTYNNGQFDGINGPGVANLINTTSTSAPSWTASGALGFASLGGMAFATNATACSDVLFTDWHGSTSGTAVTPSLASGSSYGYSGAGASVVQSNGWTASSAAAMTYQSATPPALNHSVRTCGDGSSHAGSTTFSMKYDFSNNTVGYMYFGAVGGNQTSWGGQVLVTGYSAADTNFHDQVGLGSVTNNFVTMQVGGSGSSVQFRIECNGGGGTTNFSSGINISTGTWYWVTFLNNTSVGGSIAVYTDDTLATQLGSTQTCTASGWTASILDTYQVGQGGGTSDFPTANLQTANSIMDLHGVFPLGSATP